MVERERETIITTGSGDRGSSSGTVLAAVAAILVVIVVVFLLFDRDLVGSQPGQSTKEIKADVDINLPKVNIDGGDGQSSDQQAPANGQ